VLSALPQLGVFLFGLFQDRNIGIGFFPERELRKDSIPLTARAYRDAKARIDIEKRPC